MAGALFKKGISSAALAFLLATLALSATLEARSSASTGEDPIPFGFASASNGLTGPPASQHSVWFGDINNDGDLDIATAGYEGVRVWAGDGAGNWFLNSSGLPDGSPANPGYDGGVCMGDIDNDGKLDLAAANYDFGSPGVMVWKGNGAGAWTPASTGLPNTRGHTGIFLDDINHDNNLDLAVTSDTFESNPGGIQVFTGNGAGSWSSASTNLPTSGKYYAAWMGDVNNDGNMDVAASGPGLHVWLGNGAGVWTESSTGLPTTDQWNSVTLGDINLDGNLDIVSAMDMGGHGIKAWLGDGSGTWTPASNGLPTTGLFYGVALADLVGDKYPDILAGNYGGAGIKVFKGDGGSSWTDASSGLPAGKVIGVAAGDIDNDGYIDIGAVGEGFGVQVFKNDETTPPLTVTVKEPDGGETWEILTQHYVNWTANGGTPPLTITIEYSTSGIAGPYATITSGEPNDGTFTWTVPNSPSTTCFVRVNVTDSASRTNWDKSNNSFSIFLADSTPPTISNLMPPDASVIGNNKPTISASYSDASGIALPSVTLKVDSVNVTASSIVTPTSVTYTPATALVDGVHNVYIEVRDNYVAHNLATASWSFTVDTLPPGITGLVPINQTTVGTGSPLIFAAYNDASGIDVASVTLEVDLVDVTSAATVTSSVVTYIPSVPLADGRHNVSLSVMDIVTPPNTALATWWFVVDTTIPDNTPPTISNLQPANFSSISDSTPTIHASYTDFSGIDTTSVVLSVDSIDVTPSATVTPAEVTYTPVPPLADAIHYVSLEVRDNSLNHNRAVATWQFRVDTQPPTVMSMDPANRSTIDITTPDIVASFADVSGIDTASIAFKLDSVDVTSSSVIFMTDVTYTPPTPLALGRHDVYLSVSDNAVTPNTAVRTWWFIIDASPPIISNLLPVNQSITANNIPLIGADYSDPSDVAVASVSILVDSVNVTSSAVVTIDGVTYTPPAPLSEGVHNVHLEVQDNSTLHHKATANWQFTVDSLPPTVTNLRPTNQSSITDRTPIIGANYSDASGIDLSSLQMIVDSTDVTSTATVTQTGVSFAMITAMTDGLHDVLLIVKDNSLPPNTAAVQWTFRIDTTPPNIDMAPLPSGLEVGKSVYILVEVTDASGVDTVTLYYRKVGSQQFDSMQMTYRTGAAYAATIPGSYTTSNIEYYIEANDTLGNVGRRPSSNWLTQPYLIEFPPVPQESQFPWLAVVIVIAVVIAVIVGVLLCLAVIRKRRQRVDEQGSKTKDKEA